MKFKPLTAKQLMKTKFCWQCAKELDAINTDPSLEARGNNKVEKFCIPCATKWRMAEVHNLLEEKSLLEIKLETLKELEALRK